MPIDGRDFVTRVDASWAEEWNGTEQRRTFRIESDKPFIETIAAPSIGFPGIPKDRVGARAVEFERITLCYKIPVEEATRG